MIKNRFERYLLYATLYGAIVVMLNYDRPILARSTTLKPELIKRYKERGFSRWAENQTDYPRLVRASCRRCARNSSA